MNESRSEFIDLLRGISILLVLFLHFHLSYHLSTFHNAIIDFFVKSFIQNGNYGVTIFFTISGYLITKTSLKRYGELNKISVNKFYVFRMTRIFPSILLALLIIFILSHFNLPSFSNEIQVGKNTNFLTFLSFFSVMTFWHNILMTYYNYFNYCLNIYWSLSVEEVFYIIFPIFFVFIRNKFLLNLFFFILILTGILFRAAHQDNEIYYMYHYLSCFDAIGIGCFSAIVEDKFTVSKKYSHLFFIFALTLMVLNFIIGIENNKIFGFLLISLSTSVLIIFLKNYFDDFISKNKFTRVIKNFGKYSYELYLFHIIILAILRDTITNLNNIEKIFLLFVFLIISFYISKNISYFYSEKINKKLRLYFLNRIGTIRYEDSIETNR